MPGMVEHRFFKRQLLIYLCMIPALCSLACTAGCTILNPAVSTRSAIRWDAELTWLTQDNIPIAGTRVEIADTREERLKGLKGRRLSGDEEGMLFVYPDSAVRTFIMTDTPGALDILFADEAGRIITIHEHTRPMSDTTYASLEPAMFVVEVPAGFCHRHGIRLGTKISYRRH